MVVDPVEINYISGDGQLTHEIPFTLAPECDNILTFEITSGATNGVMLHENGLLSYSGLTETGIYKI